jgi:hypothetical protein
MRDEQDRRPPDQRAAERLMELVHEYKQPGDRTISGT